MWIRPRRSDAREEDGSTTKERTTARGPAVQSEKTPAAGLSTPHEKVPPAKAKAAEKPAASEATDKPATAAPASPVATAPEGWRLWPWSLSDFNSFLTWKLWPKRPTVDDNPAPFPDVPAVTKTQ